MTREEATRIFLLLVEGSLTAEAWDSCWRQQSAEILDVLEPGYALRLRRAAREEEEEGSVAQRMHACQKVAQMALTYWQVPFVADPTWSELARVEHEAWRRNFERSVKERIAARKRRLRTLKTEHPTLARLLNRLDDWEVGEPATVEELAAVEASVDFVLPPSLSQFFRLHRSLSIGDTLRLDLDHITRFDFSHLDVSKRPACHGEVALGDFFWRADGDQLVLATHGRPPGAEFPVLYYEHEGRPPKLMHLADSFAGFLEWLADNKRKWSG
jgi:hypothetical protein